MANIIPSENKIRLFIVDDYPLISHGLIDSVTKFSSRIEIIGVSSCIAESAALIKINKPDIVLIDFNQYRESCMFISDVLSAKTKFLTISGALDKSALSSAFDAGIDGYILIKTSIAEIITAIHSIHDGGSYFSKEVVSFLNVKKERTASYKRLTKREKEILVAVAKGKRSKDIAYDFNISIRTVEVHRKKIKEKLSFKSIADFTFFALKNGLLSLELTS